MLCLDESHKKSLFIPLRAPYIILTPFILVFI